MFYENFFTNKVEVKMKSVKMRPNIFWKRGISRSIQKVQIIDNKVNNE